MAKCYISCLEKRYEIGDMMEKKENHVELYYRYIS